MQLAYDLFHNHEIVSDDEMKNMLKVKLEKDEVCAAKLEEIKNKDHVSYDKLWNDVLYSEASILFVFICNILIIINICFLYSYSKQITLKKDIISVVSRIACGQRLESTDSSPLMKIIRVNR